MFMRRLAAGLVLAGLVSTAGCKSCCGTQSNCSPAVISQTPIRPCPTCGTPPPPGVVAPPPPPGPVGPGPAYYPPGVPSSASKT
jgi:hypothetical protein